MLKSLLLLAILPLFFISAYADPHLIETVEGSGVPSCEETEIGCFTPNIITVGVGHVVTMTNPDSSSHTFTSGIVDGFTGIPDGIFNSSLLFGEDYFEWIPDIVGEYSYYCMLHPWMVGTIIVIETDESHPAPEPPFDPDVPDEPPVISIDELHSMIINNTNMMNNMSTEIDLIIEQVTQFELLITSLADIIILFQVEITELRLLLEDITEPQTLPVIINFAHSVNNGDVDISWEVFSGEPMIKYMFKWRDQFGGPWDRDIVRDETLTSWTIVGLENIEYDFEFIATNRVGVSETESFTLTP